jgi:anti-sigma factor RsiW
MIDQEAKLKLQAYVDNELSNRESLEIAARVERDPEARALCAELKEIRTLLACDELEVKLPESREFYWSKIEREILRGSAQAAEPVPSGRYWWTRFFAPAVGFAVLLITTLLVLRPHPMASRLSELHEIESPLDDTSTISFHSQSAGMTVVWVQTDGY